MWRLMRWLKDIGKAFSEYAGDPTVWFGVILTAIGIFALAAWGVTPDPTTTAIVGAVATALIIALTTKLIWRKLNTTATSSLFSEFDHKLSRVSYFKISPPILVSEAENHIHCHVRPGAFRIAPPEELDRVFDETAKFLGLEGDTLETQKLQRRFESGSFAKSCEPWPLRDTPSSTRVYANIMKDENLLEAARRKALFDYLTRNRFGFNGVFVAVNALRETREESALHEVPALAFTLQRTDYYTFRVLSELAAPNFLREFGLEKIDAGPNFSEYCAGDFQDYVHGSLGVAISVHTLKDDRLIVTRRSENTSNPLNEAGKYFMSANEALNRYDFDPNVEGVLRPLRDWVNRALREELIGEGEASDAIMRSMQRCCITGCMLYLPNMSINLCFYVALNCSSTDIREAQVRARDGRFESTIVRETKWDSLTGLPKCSAPSIAIFLRDTVGQGPIYEEWDEGAFVTTILATLACQ